MENLSKQILALLFAVVIIFPLVTTPVFALGEPTTGFWEWIPGFTPGGSFGGGGGRGDEAREEYKKYVQTLPASGYTSDGGLIWYPTIADISTSVDFYSAFSSNGNSYDSFRVSSLPYNSASLDISVSGSRSFVMVVRSSSGSSLYRLKIYPSFLVPVSGSYGRLESSMGSYQYVTTDGSIIKDSSILHSSSSFSHYSVGESIRYSFSLFDPSFDNRPKVTAATARFDFPVYRIIPDTVIAPVPGEDYSAETRPGSLVGLYGDVNGSAFSDNEITLVDESGKTIYNPVTGETYNFTDWTYDYSTRTYTITTDNSQTVTVNYGDEYVTIKEGDTIYNVYYIVQGGGGTPVDPDVCQHTYTSTTDREPTCTVPGSKTLTCSKCGNVTTESIPAKGHTWTILQTVQTSYDEKGELVQQGYTIYQCSVCGEQYKDINGTGPPDGGGEDGKKSIWEKLGDLIGSVAGGFMEVIEAVISKILDYLESLVNLINEKIGGVVDSILGLFDNIPPLFGGFTAFLAAVFPFLPQEIFDVLLLGVCLLVVAAIIRFFWKK